MESEAKIACDLNTLPALTVEQRLVFQDAATIRSVLEHRGTAAIVGLSADPQKASHQVASFLQQHGWRIIPVTPKSGIILGEQSVKDLAAIPVPIDVVDIFRPVAEVAAIVDQAIAVKARAVWMQLKLVDIGAAEKARAAGLIVVADKCMKIEIERIDGLRAAQNT